MPTAAPTITAPYRLQSSQPRAKRAMTRQYEARAADPGRPRRQHAFYSFDACDAANGSGVRARGELGYVGEETAPTRTLPSPVRRVPSRDPGRCSGPRDDHTRLAAPIARVRTAPQGE